MPITTELRSVPVLDGLSLENEDDELEEVAGGGRGKYAVPLDDVANKLVGTSQFLCLGVCFSGNLGELFPVYEELEEYWASLDELEACKGNGSLGAPKLHS